MSNSDIISVTKFVCLNGRSPCRNCYMWIRGHKQRQQLSRVVFRIITWWYILQRWYNYKIASHLYVNRKCPNKTSTRQGSSIIQTIGSYKIDTSWCNTLYTLCYSQYVHIYLTKNINPRLRIMCAVQMVSEISTR